jgi:hypothetical protein
MKTLPQLASLALGSALALGATLAFAQPRWPALPEVDLATLKPADFADDELDVPYMLRHFARVAGSVVEDGPDRGFLNIPVNRETKDNKPYNARIQEMNLALSYFYTTSRPWNPYHAHPALRTRLEAMLEFWIKRQHPTTGYFAEYSETNFSLAPTGFGVKAMSRTLERLSAPGAPPFDPDLLERTYAAQRKAIMALLTNNDSYKWGRDWSNQWSGVLRAATAYLRVKPDPEMEKALLAGARRASSEFQSPTGFLYEQAGPDFGYSGVHVQNVRDALPLLRDRKDLADIVLQEHRDYANWLSYNLVYQPRTPSTPADFFTNAGVNTRTSHSLQTPGIRPVSEFSELERAFASTTVELAAATAKRRADLERDWPKVRDLAVPSAYSYNPGNLMMPSSNWTEWAPTPDQRAAAIARFPYLASSSFTKLAFDPRENFAYLYVRRPAYYAILNSGRIRVPNRQVYGLGLLWSPTGGTFLQSVAATEWTWGTRLPNAERVLEHKSFNAPLRSGTTEVLAKPGWQDLGATADLLADYRIDDVKRTITFSPDTITVEITRDNGGAFVELLPLVQLKGDLVRIEPGKVVITRGDTVLSVDISASAVLPTLGKPAPLSRDRPDYSRALLTIPADNGKLTYTLRLTGK